LASIHSSSFICSHPSLHLFPTTYKFPNILGILKTCMSSIQGYLKPFSLFST
jgi:hypothetical protein